MSNPEWGNYQTAIEWADEILSDVLYRLGQSSPGAERVCLERIQTALTEFLEYRKRKEEEKNQRCP